jgi:hypothetical protein
MERVSQKEGCWIKQSALLAPPEEVQLIAKAIEKTWGKRADLARLL